MRRGFTLIEIMITISIFIILTTLAVPNILRSRVAADEGAAIGNLKALSNACQNYHINMGSYPDELSDLSTEDPPYIDSILGAGQKQGYQFIYGSSDSDHFTVNANSAHSGLLRGKYFYLDESGAIRSRADAPAGPNDEIIG
jgi:prepilin-type N-terminal cleavage/methylation domain-containing protein